MGSLFFCGYIVRLWTYGLADVAERVCFGQNAVLRFMLPDDEQKTGLFRSYG
ncbi:MAG: hypothetical protein NC206_04640 [Bacteroides sp.]|nr:hypothetical protein [Roseburia sp.]MCM1346352.1 hypothetical protein [Bacteroides sp.]MCM1420287.1 hypothetical protein [Bacteroides sp.]